MRCSLLFNHLVLVRSPSFSFVIWVCPWLLQSSDFFFPAYLLLESREPASDPIHSSTGFFWPQRSPCFLCWHLWRTRVNSRILSFNSALAHQLFRSTSGLVLSGGVTWVVRHVTSHRARACWWAHVPGQNARCEIVASWSYEGAVPAFFFIGVRLGTAGVTSCQADCSTFLRPIDSSLPPGSSTFSILLSSPFKCGLVSLFRSLSGTRRYS